MAKKRFIQDIVLNKPDEVVNYITQDFLNKEGFIFKEYKGEQLWQCGEGLLTAPKFFKYYYQNGTIHIEAWMKMAWLPGVYSGEMDFKGFVAAVPKSLYNNKIRDLTNLLLQSNQQGTVPDNYGQANNYEMNNVQNSGMQQVNMDLIKTHDTSNESIISLVCGIIGIIVSFILPIIGLILGSIGCVSGNKGRQSSAKGLGTAGLVLSIICIVVAVISWIGGIIISASQLIK